MNTENCLRMTTLGFLLIVLLSMGVTRDLGARPTDQPQQLRPSYEEVDRVGDIDGTANPPAKVLQDTTWIADWTFDTASGACTLAGWTSIDNRIPALADLEHHWQVNSNFSNNGNIVGDAAIVGEHDLCWVFPDGYANNWNTAIRIEYTGTTFLSFDYIIDSEGGFDFLGVETDSACASFDRVNWNLNPEMGAADFRGTPIFLVSGFDTTAGASTHVDSLALTVFNGAGPHCVYIFFSADGAFSPQDGLQPTTLGVAAVVDNIELAGGTTLDEDFTGGINNPVTVDFVSLHDSLPFGTWTRVYKHITDNDLCTENVTCALLSTDNTTPTLATTPEMAFGPGGYVVVKWLDDTLVSPWVSLTSTLGASGTAITFRRFPGNNFGGAKIVHTWNVRGRKNIDNTDSAVPGDSVTCVSRWGNGRWNSLGFFAWTTITAAMETDFPSNSSDIQIRLRTSDWDLITDGGPLPVLNPGPGPYVDRVRIGRITLTGPVIAEGIDARFQGQDAFATDRVFWSGPPTQESFAPRNTRFGTVAFSSGAESTPVGHSRGPNLITGDSITVVVQSIRPGNLTVTSVNVYGSIVDGPHAGQAPPGIAVGPSGFFVIAADSARNSSGVVVANHFFVDFDDDYFLPGDVLRYFWLAGDSGNGFASNPEGLIAPPTSIIQAQDATQGLFEVAFLPKITWDSDIVAVAQTGTSGKIPQAQLDSPPADWIDEFAGALGQQSNCILYYQQVNTRRRSGDVNRTTFMYTLDALGYRGSYDVYDHQGIGDTNNQLGGRATVPQATGYALIIYDAGNSSDFLMPNGADLFTEKIHQADWFSAYLATGSTAEIGIANLWIVSSNLMQEETARVSGSQLLSSDIGVSLAAADQGQGVNPDIDGVAAVTYSSSLSHDYSSDLWSLQGGCPSIRDYDALTPTGATVMSHAWATPGVPADPATANAAMVQKANVAAGWNAILMAFPLFDMHDPGGGGMSNPRQKLVLDVLTSLIPFHCQQAQDPVDAEDHDDVILPKTFALHRAYPNPFNPVTTIRFDVPRAGLVQLQIYDVMGRLVRTLHSATMTAGFQKRSWSGLDDSGRRVSSGLYFVRMKAAGFLTTKKIVLMK